MIYASTEANSSIFHGTGSELTSPLRTVVILLPTKPLTLLFITRTFLLKLFFIYLQWPLCLWLLIFWTFTLWPSILTPASLFLSRNNACLLPVFISITSSVASFRFSTLSALFASGPISQNSPLPAFSTQSPCLITWFLIG